MNRLIGIAGKANSGKDTLGLMIQEIDNEYKIVKYANRLKEITALLLGVDVSVFEDRVFKEHPLPSNWWVMKNKKTGEIEDYSEIIKHGSSDGYEIIKTSPRYLLQTIGTECFRKMIHPDVWVNSTFAKFDANSKWIITDVRFTNEIEKIKSMGGVVIRIDRPGYDSGSSHPSETQFLSYQNYDYIINNDGSLDDLKKAAQKMFVEMNGK